LPSNLKDNDIVEHNTTFAQKMAQHTTQVYVTTRNPANGRPYRIARFQFPPGIVQAGWSVSIEQSSRDQTFSRSAHCGESRKAGSLASPRFEVNVLNEHGQVVDISNLTDPITIEAFSNDIVRERDVTQRRVCLGYADEESSNEWNCLHSSKAQTLESGKGAFVQSRSTHLTTFAVLLMSSSQETDPCEIDWIWPTSVALIGAMIFCVLITISIGRTKRFRRYVYGFREGAQRVSQVIKAVDRKAESALHNNNDNN